MTINIKAFERQFQNEYNFLYENDNNVAGYRERTVGMMKDKMIYIATAVVMILWFMAADEALTKLGW